MRLIWAWVTRIDMGTGAASAPRAACPAGREVMRRHASLRRTSHRRDPHSPLWCHACVIMPRRGLRPGPSACPSSPITGPEETAMSHPQAEAVLTGDGADAHSITAGISLQEMRPRVLKGDDTFAVLNHSGDARAVPGGPEGIYHRDTRHLSRLESDGRRPQALAAELRRVRRRRHADLRPDQPGPARRAPAAGRSSRTWCISAAPPSSATASATKGWRCGTWRAAAAGPDRARTSPPTSPTCSRCAARPRPPRPRAPAAGRRRRGHLGLYRPRRRERETRLRFEPAPDRLTRRRRDFDWALAAGRALRSSSRSRCEPEHGSASRPTRASSRAAARPAGPPRGCRARRRDRQLQRGLQRDDARRVSDLYMLVTETPDGPYPYAGMPWFSTVFGRDALITAWQTLWLDPAIAARRARATWRHAGHRGRRGSRRRARQDPARGALRRDGGARRGAVPPLLRQHRFDAAVRRCWPAPSWTAPARSRRCAPLWPHIEAALRLDRALWRPRRRRLRRIRPHERERPGQPGLEGQPRIRSSTPTARWPRGRSRCARCRPMSTPPGAPPRDRPAPGPGTARAAALDGQGRGAAAALRGRHSGARSSAPMCWRWTATSGPAGSAPRMPGMCCWPASPRPSGRARVGGRC